MIRLFKEIVCILRRLGRQYCYGVPRLSMNDVVMQDCQDLVFFLLFHLFGVGLGRGI